MVGTYLMEACRSETHLQANILQAPSVERPSEKGVWKCKVKCHRLTSCNLRSHTCQTWSTERDISNTRKNRVESVNLSAIRRSTGGERHKIMNAPEGRSNLADNGKGTNMLRALGSNLRNTIVPQGPQD